MLFALAMLEYPNAKNVAILGDTHGLFRPELTEHLGNVDLILHSGDVGQLTVLHRLKQYAPVVAVQGNVDDHLKDLPETELVSIRGYLVYVLHVLANLNLDAAVAGFAMVVSGHSHQPLIRKAKGVLYVNPGSVGPRRFKLPVCFVKADFSEAGIETKLVQLIP
jgi:putative phosphoesterase